MILSSANSWIVSLGIALGQSSGPGVRALGSGPRHPSMAGGRRGPHAARMLPPLAHRHGDLLDFEEVRRRLRLGTRLPVGRQEIPIAEIVGSMQRTHDFDAGFQPRSRRLRRLLHEIEVGAPDHIDRPISVVQVDRAYFVEDGHKRLAIAVSQGRRYIDADVDRYETRFQVDGATTVDALRATQAELRFREATALDRAVPGVRFPLTEPVGYLELEESVKAHAFDLAHQRGVLIDRAEAAAHWYETVFRPVVTLAQGTHVAVCLGSCTDGDLFLLFRRGIQGGMDADWHIPVEAAEQGVANVRAASPAGVGGVLRDLTRRRGPRAPILAEREDRDRPPR